MSALSYGIICADCKRSSSGLCGVHSNRTILFPHAFPGLGHTESREAVNNGPLTMAMIEDVLLTIATAQGPCIDLDAMDTRARTTTHFSPAPGPIALANDVLALIARVRGQEQEIAKLKEELDEEIDHNARLSAKLDETKHNCACDYDERGAVCLVHTRPVREARERIAALEAERDELRKKIADGRYVVPDDYIHIVFGRKE